MASRRKVMQIAAELSELLLMPATIAERCSLAAQAVQQVLAQTLRDVALSCADVLVRIACSLQTWQLLVRVNAWDARAYALL